MIMGNLRLFKYLVSFPAEVESLLLSSSHSLARFSSVRVAPDKAKIMQITSCCNFFPA